MYFNAPLPVKVRSSTDLAHGTVVSPMRKVLSSMRTPEWPAWDESVPAEVGLNRMTD